MNFDTKALKIANYSMEAEAVFLELFPASAIFYMTKLIIDFQ